ncbi:MAG: hypothetical protein IJ133_02325 [Clostridia bacterium]|nr:hypothetical protein [Clostridia bacterium]
MEHRLWTRLLGGLTALLLSLLLIFPAFAAYSPDSSGAVYIPDGTTEISAGTVSKSASALTNVKVVYVPASVKRIRSGTFVGYLNLKQVVVRNDRASVKVEYGATSGQTKVVFTGAPTSRPATTTTRAPVTEPASLSSDTLRKEQHRLSDNKKVEGIQQNKAGAPKTDRNGKVVTRKAEQMREQLPTDALDPSKEEESTTQSEDTSFQKEEISAIFIPDSDRYLDQKSEGQRGLRIASAIAVAAAGISAVVLLLMKFKPKQK